MVDSEDEEEQKQFEQELQQWKKTEVCRDTLNVDTAPSLCTHMQTGSFQNIKAEVRIQNGGWTHGMSFICCPK